MGRTIAIVSAKGGVGKTVTTLNLAAAFHRLQLNPIAVDADVTASGLALQLGMSRFSHTIHDLLQRRARPAEAIAIHQSGLRVIPAALTGTQPALRHLHRLLRDPAIRDAAIFVDAPPGLDDNLAAVLRSCAEAVLVTTPDIPAVAAAMRTSRLAEQAGSNLLGLVINRFQRGQLTVQEIQQATGLPILGMIPEDPAVGRSLLARSPVVLSAPYSRAGLAFQQLAHRIAGRPYRKPHALQRLLRSAIR